MKSKKYCNSLLGYSPRTTVEVNIGGVPMGGDNPIRIQSMTTVDTMDTNGSVEQAIRMIEAGSEYVRLTAPGKKDAENLENIKNNLRGQGYKTPLVADIHFTPNAAETAAQIVEKVRINPGNYIDRKKFESMEYSDEEYQEEVARIREKFVPLVNLCKEHGTALRIGTNHGSLSDRIMSRYGDTPLGMVESALEFLRICEEENFDQVVLSMKASNTLVMVQAYRLLVNKLKEEGLKPYPLHLGVTEAGEGEDGRIKSAVGIGALLEDGLGDTIRVSLTEEPEFEIPVARALVERYAQRESDQKIDDYEPAYDPFSYSRRLTSEVGIVGGQQVPVVVADLSGLDEIKNETLKLVGHHYLNAQDKWLISDQAADLIYLGDNSIDIDLPVSLGQIYNYEKWNTLIKESNQYPLFSVSNYLPLENQNFLKLNVSGDEIPANLGENTVIILETSDSHAMASIRRFVNDMMLKGIGNPVIITRKSDEDIEKMQLHAATDFGGLLVDGFGDGVMLTYPDLALANQTAFGILQAARTRMTKTEYISCPSCGRTLFDLQETTAKIRTRTDHLKGLKIGIMGCIVNGPGEMADADYGYVGSGPGKITLYKGQDVVKKGLESEHAVDELINLIKENGDWVEPEI
ncbi:MAG: (E)-4-hydroxy-3-methylbut-2-enyl-diphosphate synthase [Bacteroidota bacterium]